jgi:hypothetical protein
MGKKWLKKKGLFALVSILAVCIATLAALCTTASAGYYGAGCPYDNWYNGTINGGIYFEIKGHYTGVGETLNETFEGVPDGRRIVRLYPGVWLGSPQEDRVTNFTITINGHTDTYSFTDTRSSCMDPSLCVIVDEPECNADYTGCGVVSISYNASPYVVTGTNYINVSTSNEQLYHIALLVIYENAGMSEMQYWIKEGHEYPDADFSLYFNETVNTGPIDPDNIESLKFWTLGYPHCVRSAEWPTLNENYINACDYVYSYDAGGEVYEGSPSPSGKEFEVLYRWDNISSDYITSSSNHFRYPTLGNDRLMVPVLVLNYGAPKLPDLNVSCIIINPGDTRGNDIVRVYVNESNNISAVVWNNGSASAGAFDVCFDADGVKIGCVEMEGLAAGANTTVSIDWIPTCANYPVMPGFPAQSLPITINVTADCNCTDCPTCPDDGSNGKIAESDEGNNTLSKVIPAIQAYSGYDVIGGVVNNGYKSKNFDCTLTEEPLTLFEYDDMYGGVAYNVSGAKITLKPTNTSTRIHSITIPSGMTVKKARLYVYWYDAWGNYKAYPTGCLANLSVNFSGTEFMPGVKYNDQKGFGYYHSPKGTYAYDVTTKVIDSGDYSAVVKNIDPNNQTTLLGEMLLVVYEDPDSNLRNKRLWILEGNDYLMASHGTYQFCTSPEEATATVAFPGSIDLANVGSATLVSVVLEGMTPGSNMLFNGNVIKSDAWQDEVYPNSWVNVESEDVKSYLTSSCSNNMGFQDNGTDGMQATNAFLVVEYKEAIVPIFDTSSPENPYPSIFGTHNGTITAKYDIPVSKMYTYPCAGAGGHSEYIEIWNASTGWSVNASWNGYKDDWRNISFDEPFILEADKIYNYTIRTGSYPQIHHRAELEAAGGMGTIRCTKFTDANGNVYNNWIPAIKLY